MSNRVITAVSTRGARVEKFEVENGKTWGEVRDILRVKYPEIEEMVAVESVDKTTLGSFESIIPDGDIRIFLRPGNTKAGNDFEKMSFSELREFIKENPESKVQLTSMSEEGKNWTQLSKDNLSEYLTKIYKPTRKNPLLDAIIEEEIEEEFEEEIEEETHIDFEMVEEFLEEELCGNTIVSDEDIHFIENISIICNDFLNSHYKEMRDINKNIKNLGFSLDSDC